ncbi:hypothetical protein [Streptomyces sp. NBC_00258]|uniref:hypothetical protein n=1 Tax=Streptomyces sp. NBC_00258 TaxID=2903642 RepID=UPI002E2B5FBC|nr:hypothetical protein [Streptomyces sp. NBC_00258]
MAVEVVLVGTSGQTWEDEGEVRPFPDDGSEQYAYSVNPGGALLVWKFDRQAAPPEVEVAYAPHAWIKATGRHRKE